MKSFSVIRLLAAVVVAVGLSVAAGNPSAAQDDEENGRTAAQEVRELVLKQRERVLAHVAAIMAGDEEDTESAKKDVDEAEDGEGEDGEAEDGEGEDGEAEDGEGVGGEGEECEAVGGGAEGEAAAGDEAEGNAAAGDEAEAGEEEDGEAVGGEGEDAQSAVGGTDAPGEQEICILPSTGTGSNNDTDGMLSVFAALMAVVAAGFGLRQRFI